MDYDVMEQYWIWLSSVGGIGPKRFYALLSRYQDARAVWDAVKAGEDFSCLGSAAAQQLRACCDEKYFFTLFSTLAALDISAVTRLRDAYPAALTNIYDPPPTLYVRGDFRIDVEKCIAVVGSRRCTRDGQRAAREIARGLAQKGVCVVSGLARGIDTAAHTGALEGGGKTIAVLGCGVDIVYPPENENLLEDILSSGGAVVSEYVPGTLPVPGNFPARNRIISGLCRGTLIVEGARGSGAMITVNCALEQQRDVFSVPGSIYSPASAMPNQLIVEGAAPVLSHWEILEYYRWAQRPDVKREKPAEIALEMEEREVVLQLSRQEMYFDELAGATNIPAAKLNSYLTMLELRGIIVKAPGGAYRAYQ